MFRLFSDDNNEIKTKSLVTERFPPFHYIKFTGYFKNLKKNEVFFLNGQIPRGATKILSSYIKTSSIYPEEKTFINVGIGDRHDIILNNFPVDVLNKSGIEGKGNFSSPIKNFYFTDKINISFNNDISEGKIELQILFLTPVHN